VIDVYELLRLLVLPDLELFLRAGLFSQTPEMNAVAVFVRIFVYLQEGVG
jgi:hypothetical protein